MTIDLPPARKIPKNYRNVTGVVAGTADTDSVVFESTLENDFYQLLRFDLYVSRIKEQPVKIKFTDPAGKIRSYTPDVLVSFREDLRPAINMKPWLCEVKYRGDLWENWQEYRPKFKAAVHFAKKNGWRFRIITEKEVRTPFLKNARFLFSYRTIVPDVADIRLILDTLYQLRETDPENLLLALSQDRWHRAALMPTLWHLVAWKRVGVDFTLPVTMRSRIWSIEPK